MPLAAGTHLGRFEIIAPLGSGGMGEVYRARDGRLDRTVAIKVLPAHTAADPAFRERFEREARSASALNHPNILSVFDVGRDRDVDYLITELVDGATLRTRTGDRGLPPREVVAIGAQICEGLAAAHSAGLVHRDLKPDNIMVTRDGRVKILDFGLAKPLDDTIAGENTRTAISHAGLLVGTAGYVSPEQIRGAAASPQSDLFALGAVLYEITTARRAFDRPTIVETFNAILNDDIPELPASVPVGLQQIIAHCLEKEPGRRFQTAADVAFALRSFATTTTTALPLPATTRVIGKTSIGVIVTAGAALFLGGFVASRLSLPAPVNLNAIDIVPFAIEAPAETSAAISPDGRSIAYFRTTGDTSDIVVKSENSPALTVLSRRPARPSQYLFWAPDGERIYFSESLQLRSIATVGGDVREELADVSGADVAPDAETFAVIKVNEALASREAQLFVGPRERLRLYEPPPVSGVFDCVPNFVRFSPDGSKILLWSACGGNGVFIVPAPDREGRGGPARRMWEGTLDSIPQGIDWLNDSRHVVLANRNNLWLGDTIAGGLMRVTTAIMPMNEPLAGPDNTIAFTEQIEDYDVVELPLAGGTPRLVVNSAQYDGDAAWSPRGGTLAYVADRGQGDEIWIRTPGDLSERRLLTPRDFPDQAPERIRALTFSADGQWLAFTAYTLAPELRGGVWVVPAGGGTPRLISPKDALTTRGSWSPDGRSMALYLTRGGPAELWLASIGSSAMRQIELPPGLNLRQIEWSPTGEFLAALESRLDGGPRATILIDPASGAVRRLPTLGSRAIAWSPDGSLLYGAGDSDAGTHLRALNLATGAVRTVATYDTDLRISENIGNSLRLSMSADGKSLVTTAYTNRSNVWLLRGLQPPRRRWWAFGELKPYGDSPNAALRHLASSPRKSCPAPSITRRAVLPSHYVTESECLPGLGPQKEVTLD